MKLFAALNKKGPASVLAGVLIVLSLAGAVMAQTQSQKQGTDWGVFSNLIGEWAGEGSGKPGLGPGDISFRWDLDRHVIVSRGHSEYPAQGNKPASIHDQLMVIFTPASENPTRAIYFDNEGHTIEYAVTMSAHAAQFISEPGSTQPRFRLTYSIDANDSLEIKFEIAPPGNPNGFSTYIEGRAKRRHS